MSNSLSLLLTGLMFTGDTLFLKNVGRTDLPGALALPRMFGPLDIAEEIDSAQFCQRIHNWTRRNPRQSAWVSSVPRPTHVFNFVIWICVKAAFTWFYILYNSNSGLRSHQLWSLKALLIVSLIDRFWGQQIWCWVLRWWSHFLATQPCSIEWRCGWGANSAGA